MRGRAALLAAAGLLLTGASLAAHREVEAGNRALQAGDPKGAASHYESALKARPDDPAVRYDLGTARLAAGDLDPAVDDLGRAAQHAGGDLRGDAAYNLGNALMARAQGKGTEGRADLQAAVQAYREAVAASPADADARRNLQLAATRLKDLERQAPPPPQQGAGQPKEGNPGKSGQPEPGHGTPSPGSGGSPQAGGAHGDQTPGSGSTGGEKGNEAKPEGNRPGGSGPSTAQGPQGQAPGATAGTPPGQGPNGPASGAAGTPPGTTGGDQGGNAAQGAAPVPEDVAQVLSVLRQQEAATLREAMRRSLGKPQPEDKDW